MIELIFIFLIVTALWLSYWLFVRPILLDSVEEDFAILHSQADWAIIEELPKSQTKPALQLVSNLQHSTAIRWISLGAILLAMIRFRRQAKISAKADRELFEDCPTWMREIREKDMILTMKAALVNSPTWWGPIAILLLASIFSKKVSRLWNEVQSTASKLRAENIPIPA